MLSKGILLAAMAATASAYVATPMYSRSGVASLTSLKMAQAPPPAKDTPVNLAKKNAMASNKANWAIEAPLGADAPKREGYMGASAPAAGAAPKAAAPAAAAAAPAPKKASAKAGAEDGAPASLGFSGVPSAFSRPGPSVFPAEPEGQTVLGMRGPRAPGHREKFGSRHAAVSLACAALVFQPISQAGMYTMGDGSLNKASFATMEVPGFGNTKNVPTIESFFPFQKNGFSASGTLFGKDSMIVFENPLGKCGAYASSCHTFLDEIGDALKATPQELPRSEGKATYSFPWMYDHATWKK